MFIVSGSSALTSAIEVGDTEWILYINAMYLKSVQVLHPSVLLFFDVSWVYDCQDAKFYVSIEFF